MTPAVALRLTPGACLVARPTGVLHLYRGTLTPSGCVPRRDRSVCRVRTRQLRIVGVVDAADRRLCARCSARLNLRQPALTTRDDYLARYAHVTPDDLVIELDAATTPAEVDTAAHLTLLLCPPAQSRQMHKLVGHHRLRVSEEPSRLDKRLKIHGEVARSARKAERAEIYTQAQARIARLGINIAKPLPPRKEPR